MKGTILLMLLTTSLICNAQTEKTKDSLNYTIIQLDSTNNWINRKAKTANLSLEEIEEVELLMKKCITEYNREQEAQFEKMKRDLPKLKLKKEDFLISLDNYYRQYVPMINEKGEKEIWINCFCADFDTEWKNQLILVDDGGNCFFNLMINLDGMSFYDLMVNGHA
jgi:hypothetical protein